MAGERKAFFQEPDAAQFVYLYDRLTKQRTPEGLVDLIEGIDPHNEALILTFSPTPGKFYRGGHSSSRASRLNLRHGQYLLLRQPNSVEEATRRTEIPLDLRLEAFDALHEGPPLAHVVGYGYRVLFGADRGRRVRIPFAHLLLGCKIDAHGERLRRNPLQVGSGAQVYALDAALRAEREGADIIVKVPSMTEGKGRYVSYWKHVAVCETPERRAVWWATVCRYVRLPFEAEEARSGIPEPEHRLFSNIRFESLYSRFSSSAVALVDPHDVAAYQAIIRHYMRKRPKNLVPFGGSQFAVPSKRAAEFFRRIRNNLAVQESRDGSLTLRKLHLDEQSILLGWLVAQHGGKEIMFWSEKRDGPIRDYPFSLEGK